MRRTLSKAKIVPIDCRDISRVEHCFRFDITFDDISSVPDDWTQIQIYVKSQDNCIADVVFDCSEGRACLRSTNLKDRIVFLLWLAKEHPGDKHFLSKDIEIGVRYWSIETLTVVCRTASKTSIDAAIHASGRKQTKKLLLPLNSVETCEAKIALVLDVQLTTTPVVAQTPRKERSGKEQTSHTTARTVDRCASLPCTFMKDRGPEIVRHSSTESSDSLCTERSTKVISETPSGMLSSLSMPAILFTELEPLTKLAEETNEICGASVAALATEVGFSVASASTQTYSWICADDMDEVEYCPSEKTGTEHSASCVISSRTSVDDEHREHIAKNRTVESDEDPFEWLADESEKKTSNTDHDVYLTMGDLVMSRTCMKDLSIADIDGRPDGEAANEKHTSSAKSRPTSTAVGSQTDQTLKRLKVPRWNRNPSFEDRAPQHSTDSAMRTADWHLVEVGRQALARGLVKDIPEIVKCDRNPQVTGRDGLSWDENPTYSEDGSPHSQSNGHRPENTSESPMTALAMTRRNSSRNTHSRSGSAYFSNPSRSPSAERPWMQNDDDLYEWMDVLRMRDVGVQTAFEQEDDDHYEMIFSPVGSQENIADHTSSPNEKDVHTEHNSEKDDLAKATAQHQDVHFSSLENAGLSWVNKGEPLSTEGQREELPVGVSQNVDPPSRDRPRRGCSTSAESDTFNNLRLAHLMEQPLSPVNGLSPGHKRRVSQEVVKTSLSQTREATRIDQLEHELRMLKKRVTDLEIELCNRESIISQQDAVIHRFTSNLRTQRMHRRNFSALPSVSSFMDTSKPSFESSHRSIHSIAEEPKNEVQEIVHAQQELLRKLLGDLEKCQVV